VVKHLAPKAKGSDIYEREVKEPELAQPSVYSGQIAAGSIFSGHIASGQIGLYHVYCRKGFVSSANTTLTAYHNLGFTPPAQNVCITPAANANFWIASVNDSAIVINSSVSGTGCYWKVFAD